MTVSSMAGRIRTVHLTTRRPMSFLGHSIAIEPVPQTAQRPEKARSFRRRFDLLAEIRDLVVDDAFGHVCLAPPDLVQQLSARQHAAFATNEGREQPILERGEIDRAALPRELATVTVECAVAETVDRRRV